MAINIAHRRDLDERVERLAARLALRGRGRKTAIIERALERLAQAGDRHEERERMRGSDTGGDRPASESWQDELYDDHGLPR